MQKLDHKKLVDRDRSEIAKLKSLTAPERITAFGVEHEADWSCCRAESWEQTMYFFKLAECPDDPTLVNINVTDSPSRPR